MIHRFKFAGDLALGRWLGERLADRVMGAGRPDLLVATPLAADRLHARGFNQALVLAGVVAARLGLPLERRALERRAGLAPQVGLTRAERLANLDGAFTAARRFDGQTVALVDDVLTTGATAEAIGRVLREAGAARVSAWVVAHTPAPGT